MATLTPYSLQAETHVNGHRLSETNYNAQRPQQQSNAAPLRNVNSRSVPALHEQQLQPVGGPSACQTDIQQQIYYPSQQQTAKPTSPTQTTGAQHQTTRSRSVQNLSEQQQRGSTLRARHPSDERQYQNIALYQQQQQLQEQQGTRPQCVQQQLQPK